MRQANLQSMSVDQLVDRFARITQKQDRAIDENSNANYKRLFSQMRDVELELKARTGDMRKSLLRLFNHPVLQVQLAAARATVGGRARGCAGKAS